MREAKQTGDRSRLRELERELQAAETAWDEALASIPPRREPQSPAGPVGPTQASLVPFREQVHHALTLLTVPAAPRMIAAVHAAFFGADLPSARFTSLRRDEEKSFRSSPYARPYYLCPALTTERLSPVRGLLSISTWPVAERLVGPLSPRVHFLTAAIKVAEAVARAEQPRPGARRLLIRFAANIPGGDDGGGTPAAIIGAARNELVIHAEADRAEREAAVERVERLDDVQRLFGTRLAAAAEEAG